MTTKTCVTCKETKETTEFSLRGGKRYDAVYYKSECKACASKRARKWVKENRDYFNQYQNERAKRLLRESKVQNTVQERA